MGVEAVIGSLIGLSGLLIVGGMSWLRADIRGLRTEMRHRFDKVDEQRRDDLAAISERFDKVDERFDEVIGVLAGQGERIARLEGPNLVAATAGDQWTGSPRFVGQRGFGCLAGSVCHAQRNRTRRR